MKNKKTSPSHARQQKWNVFFICEFISLVTFFFLLFHCAVVCLVPCVSREVSTLPGYLYAHHQRANTFHGNNILEMCF